MCTLETQATLQESKDLVKETESFVESDCTREFFLFVREKMPLEVRCAWKDNYD